MTLTRALTMLNEQGDVTIAWNQDQDEEMERVIAAKMKQGVTFFIIAPRLNGLAAPDTSKQLKRACDAHKHRALAIRDEDFAKFVSDGKGVAVATPAAPVKNTRRSKDAKEVSRSQSVGVRPMAGG